ncbi:MAG TPA: 3,4-dihydroxy-2-butanone-4-phosphate synthase, partial [Myxococcota bacterium]|nr:3,4-dihydroxy-2-butanone-4-phosphate synthase [Myxococcota bacterium]
MSGGKTDREGERPASNGGSAPSPLDDVLARVRGGIEDFRAGRMVILADDEDRENEGDVCIAASHCTPEAVNFMARHARGLICLAITPERARQLD